MGLGLQGFMVPSFPPPKKRLGLRVEQVLMNPASLVLDCYILERRLSPNFSGMYKIYQKKTLKP